MRKNSDTRRQVSGHEFTWIIHEVYDGEGKTTHQRWRRGQRLAHREAVGKLEKKCKPWRGETPGEFISYDIVLSMEFNTRAPEGAAQIARYSNPKTV